MLRSKRIKKPSFKVKENQQQQEEKLHAEDNKRLAAIPVIAICSYLKYASTTYSPSYIQSVNNLIFIV